MRNIHIDLLQDYVDDELGMRERLQLARHLGANAHDRARVETYQAQRDELLRMYSDKLHEPLPESIQELIDRVPTVGGTGGGHGAEGRDPQQAEAAESHRGAPDVKEEPVRTLVKQAVQSYNFYSGARGQPALFERKRLREFRDWFERQMSTRVIIPQLDEFGFFVLHARLLPWAPGSAGQVLYEDAAGRILATYFHVFCGSRCATASMRPVCTERDRLSIYCWQRQTVYYAMVAAMSQRELTRIAQAVTY